MKFPEIVGENNVSPKIQETVGERGFFGPLFAPFFVFMTVFFYKIARGRVIGGKSSSQFRVEIKK